MSANPPTKAALARLAARRRRPRDIRRGVGAATVATFALAWGVIAHDGAMGTTTTASTTTGGDSTGTSTDQGSSSTTTIAPDAPVTSAQS